MTKLKVTWTPDIWQELAALEAMNYCPRFYKLYEWVHHMAWKWGIHDLVVGSWWFKAWGKIEVQSPKNDQFLTILSQEITKEIDAQIIIDVREQLKKEGL